MSVLQFKVISSKGKTLKRGIRRFDSAKRFAYKKVKNGHKIVSITSITFTDEGIEKGFSVVSSPVAQVMNVDGIIVFWDKKIQVPHILKSDGSLGKKFTKRVK